MTKPVSEIDVFRSAKLIIEQHGEDSPLVAAARADELLEKGDIDGQRTWLRILKAIDMLLLKKPKLGFGLH